MALFELDDVNRLLDGFSGGAARRSENLFSEGSRAWSRDDKPTPRCDFTLRPKIVHKPVPVITLWPRTVYGERLTDIKADSSRIDFFATHIHKYISQLLGHALAAGGWAIVAVPPRRHKVDNFAVAVAKNLAEMAGITCHDDVAEAVNCHRVKPDFRLLKMPPEPNLIVVDDIVTTGSTLMAMRNLLVTSGKNVILIAGICNNV